MGAFVDMLNKEIKEHTEKHGLPPLPSEIGVEHWLNEIAEVEAERDKLKLALELWEHDYGECRDDMKNLLAKWKEDRDRLEEATRFINGLESYPCLRDVGKCTTGEVLGELCPSCAARIIGPKLEVEDGERSDESKPAQAAGAADRQDAEGAEPHPTDAEREGRED